jgi:hypothetical protein
VILRTALHSLASRLALLAACAALWPLPGGAEQSSASGNAGTINAQARLDFQINIYKFVFLRVGAADATSTNVEFRVGVTPAAGVGNAQPYAGAIPGVSTAVSTTNPATGAGSVAVQAFTNVTGTTLSCSLSALGGATAFLAGATAGGVPGRADIDVATTGTVSHPGTDLAACNGVTTTAVAPLTNIAGTFVYSAAFAAGNLAAGTYGNVVTYTLTAP